MAMNLPGVYTRTADDESQDRARAVENILDESWKSWPNEAAFNNLDEHRGPLPLRVTGFIPPWAAGALYRTGPGLSQVETSRGTHYVSHWFDGFAHTHKFDIIPPSDSSQSATVEYSSRRQSDDYVEQVQRTGWRSSTSFGQRADPCVGLFAKVMSVFEPRRFNNNVVVHTNVPGFPSALPPVSEETYRDSPAASGHRATPKNLFVGTDNCSIMEADPTTLEPLGFARQSVLHPALNGPLSCAHAQRDPENGDMFNFNLVLGRAPTYRVFRINAATGTTDILATISDPSVLKPAYVHSFFLTQKYVVLALPCAHFGWNGLKIVWNRNLLEAVQPFDKHSLVQYIVIDRRSNGGVVGRFTGPAGFFFHSVNAFDRLCQNEKTGLSEEEICVDAVMYDNTDVMMGFYYDVLMDRDDAAKKHWLTAQRYSNGHPRLTRYRFVLPASPPSSSSTTASSATYKNINDIATPAPPIIPGEEVFSIPGPHAGDLPTINPAYACKPTYRYVYSVPSRGLSTLVDCLAKTDLRTRETKVWCGPQGHSPGEPIFIPRPKVAKSSTPAGGGGGNKDVDPEEVEEDDGVLLSVVLDGEKEMSYLLCLDAKTMEEVGRAEAEFAIAMGFHGVHERL